MRIFMDKSGALTVAMGDVWIDRDSEMQLNSGSSSGERSWDDDVSIELPEGRAEELMDAFFNVLEEIIHE